MALVALLCAILTLTSTLNGVECGNQNLENWVYAGDQALEVRLELDLGNTDCTCLHSKRRKNNAECNYAVCKFVEALSIILNNF
jgi:hypothetical protein